MSDINDPTLTVRDRIYGGWKSLTIARGIDRMASHFSIDLNERWNPVDPPWQIKTFDPIELRIGSDLVLTGYVDIFSSDIQPRRHEVKVSGRSKTEDIIDCTPELPGGQFSGYKLDQIARAIAQPFGIDVVVQADVGEAFPDATIQKHETGYRFLERLARLRRVLLSGDAQGRLVLTTAGASRSGTTLKLGGNLNGLHLIENVSGRFSEYRVRVQSQATTTPSLRRIDAPPPAPDPTTSVAAQRAAAAASADYQDPPQTQATTTTAGTAYDHNVPRYRPHTVIAESALNALGAQARSLWEAAYAFGQSLHLAADVTGWRKNDGALWQINQLVSIEGAPLQLDAELLIVGVTHTIEPRRGRVTQLRLGPPEGYAPDPGQVRVHKARGAGGGNPYGNLKGIDRKQ